MDIHILQSVSAAMCLHLVFIFKKINTRGGGVYVCMKGELCGQGRKEAYVEAEAVLSCNLT